MSALEFGAGVVMALGASGMPAPEPSSYTLPRSGEVVRESSFAGFSFGAGAQAEVRAFEVLGLSAGALYRRDAASATLTRAGEELTLTLSAPALHVPLVLRGVYPLRPIAPFVLVGAELVLPGLGQAEVAPEGAHGAVASLESYTLLLLGAGAELSSDALGGFRPSAAFSFGFRPGKSEELAERATVLPSDAVIYDAAFSWQATLELGVAHFW